MECYVLSSRHSKVNILKKVFISNSFAPNFFHRIKCIDGSDQLLNIKYSYSYVYVYIHKNVYILFFARAFVCTCTCKNVDVYARIGARVCYKKTQEGSVRKLLGNVKKVKWIYNNI
jgi:hypothetical protein